MCSVHDPAVAEGWRSLISRLVMGVAALAILAGCGHKARTPSSLSAPLAPAPGPQTGMAPGTVVARIEPVSGVTAPTVPVRVDSKGLLYRDWPLSVCYQPSGDVTAAPTYFGDPERSIWRSELLNLFSEPGEFLLNIALLPVRGVHQAPWVRLIYSAVGPPGQEHLLYGQPWLDTPGELRAQAGQQPVTVQSATSGSGGK